LIDSLYQHSSVPLAITPLVTPQLENQGLFHRERDPKQSTAFSFTRFLVPYLMGYQGWALFMDCDMLCQADIKALWDQRDDRYGAMCVQHEHVPGETVKFLGEVQSAYPKKNWSSLMLLNCSRCTNLTVDYVNTASGLELHRFHWLEGDHEIGAIQGGMEPFGGCTATSRTGGAGANAALDVRVALGFANSARWEARWPLNGLLPVMKPSSSGTNGNSEMCRCCSSSFAVVAAAQQGSGRYRWQTDDSAGSRALS
jgi:hypothetical protein